MEIVDIDLDNVVLGTEMSSSSSGKTTNFGGGLEFLMNEKKKSANTKIDLGELDNLESELNKLSEDIGDTTPINKGAGTKQLSGLNGFSNLFNFSGNNKHATSQPIQSSDLYESDATLGQSTKDATSGIGHSTWDGFSKVSGDIPQTRPNTYLSEREKRRKKRMMIKKLDEWRDKGTLKNGTQFDIDSSFDEVEDEYEGALEDKRRKDSIKLQGWWFTTIINTLEYGNALINPFDLNLDGWGEQVGEDLDSYDDIFSELYDKYKGGKMAPEISILLRIGFSAAVVNMSNKMLSSATPGFSDVIKQSPELMKAFSSAAVNTMSQQNTAFDFAKTMLNQPEQVNTRYGPPPTAIDTKKQAPPSRPGSMQFTPAVGNRPDLAAAASVRNIPPPMFRESGVELNQPASVNTRPEMKGPPTTDIDQLLSGLKKKREGPIVEDVITGDDSVISVTSLIDMKNTAMPKKVKRRNNSDKNTVSLDI
jgi:hypothetical protein